MTASSKVFSSLIALPHYPNDDPYVSSGEDLSTDIITAGNILSKI